MRGRVWTRSGGRGCRRAGALRERVRGWVVAEPDDRVPIWARVKLGGERPVAVAKEFGYRNQSGVATW